MSYQKDEDIVNEKYKNVYDKSVGDHGKQEFTTKKDKELVFPLPSKFVCKVCAAIISLVMTTAVLDDVGFLDRVHHYVQVQEAEILASGDILFLLADNYLNTVPNPDTQEWRNDYSVLEGKIDESDLYGFVCHCGYDEAERIVNMLGYDGWDGFCLENGYLDKSGNPSKRVWRNYAEVEYIRENMGKGK